MLANDSHCNTFPDVLPAVPAIAAAVAFNNLQIGLREYERHTTFVSLRGKKTVSILNEITAVSEEKVSPIRQADQLRRYIALDKPAAVMLLPLPTESAVARTIKWFVLTKQHNGPHKQT